MSEKPQIFRIKPALLVAARDYHIYTDRLEVWHKGELKDRLEYRAITAARYAVTTAREYKFRRIDLTADTKKPLQINVTSGLNSNRANDDDVHTLFDMITALSTHLSDIFPDMRVTIGETPKATWIMFLIGAAAVLAALGMLALAIAVNVPDYKLKNALMPFAVLLIFGLYICWNSRPWRPKARLSWAELKLVIALEA